MIRKFPLLFPLIIIACISFGQDNSKINLDSLYLSNILKANRPLDSLYFLDINITYKLNIIKHKRKFSRPYEMIDFPDCYYDSTKKTIAIKNYTYELYKVSDSTIALIKIGFWTDDSYGSGGATDLVELNKFSPVQKIDSLIKYDSISSTGVFYLTIKDQNFKFYINRDYAFVDHKEVKTREALFDYITEYSIKNYGLIRREFEYY
jgi:hypothetical protein